MTNHTFKTFLTDEYVRNYTTFLESYKKHHPDRNDKFVVCYYKQSFKSKLALHDKPCELHRLERLIPPKSNQIERLNNAFGKLDVVLNSEEEFILHDYDLYFVNEFDFTILEDVTLLNK